MASRPEDHTVIDSGNGRSDDQGDGRDHGDGAAAGAEAEPAARLLARAQEVDRAARFEDRLAGVERARTRRRQVRRVVRVVWVAVFAAVGALTPLVVAAVLVAPGPSGWAVLAGAGVGAVLGAIGPTARNWLARRRGASAWDAYHERYVLLGDPSAGVRDADRPRGGPTPPRTPPR